MPDPTPDTAVWVPATCTLPTAAQPLRVAEFDALFTVAARAGERLSPLHLRVTLPDNLADTVRDLTDREAQCCSFFTFTVTATQPGQVRLDIEVTAGHLDVLDALAIRVAGARDRS